jgi:hypothetical protein
MSRQSQLRFSTDRADAVAAIASIDSGRGWCNVVAVVTDDVPDLKVNFFGLWANRGAAMASYVSSPPLRGEPQPGSLGVLHSRGRLGLELINSLLGSESFKVLQDHSQRGLLLEIPPDTAPGSILEVMCTFSSALCDYEMTGSWRLDLYTRS